MANVPEIVLFDAGVYQIETTDPVLGGPEGIANLQAKALANRTAFLKKQLDDILSGLNVPVGLATIAYIQAQLDKLDHKQSVRVATTANISLSGVQTIDGIAVQAGDRVLVKNQADATQNGILTVSGSAWSRATDANESGEVTSGLIVYVEEGTLQGKGRWQLTTPSPIVIGTTALTFGNVTAGMAPLNSPSLTGSPTAPALAQFAVGLGLVNADALKVRGNEFSRIRSIALSVSTVTLVAADAGSAVVITGSGGGTLVLPKASAVTPGAAIAVRAANTAVSTNTIAVQAGDSLSGLIASASTTPNILRSGDTLTLVSDGASTWTAVSDSTYNAAISQIAQFFLSNQAAQSNGYVKLPGGLIISWAEQGYGPVNANSSGTQAAAFPVTFPNGMLKVIHCGSTAQCIIGTSAIGLNSITFTLRNVTAGADSGVIRFLAIGW